MKYKEADLVSYIEFLANYQAFSDIDNAIMDNLKKYDSNFYGRKIINFLNREKYNLSRRTAISQDKIKKIAAKLYLYLDNSNPSNIDIEILKECIIKTLDNGHRAFYWEDAEKYKITTDTIIESSLSSFYWLEEIKKEESNLIAQPRDRHKIIEAIDTLQNAFDDVHLLYELKKARQRFDTKRLKKDIVLKSFFFKIHRTLVNELQLPTTTKAVSIANMLIKDIFDNSKGYKYNKAMDVVCFEYKDVKFYYYKNK